MKQSRYKQKLAYVVNAFESLDPVPLTSSTAIVHCFVLHVMPNELIARNMCDNDMESHLRFANIVSQRRQGKGRIIEKRREERREEKKREERREEKNMKEERREETEREKRREERRLRRGEERRGDK